MRIPDLKVFALAMKDMNHLIELVIQGNFIDEEMIKWLNAGLISNHTVQMLDLSNNQLDDKAYESVYLE